MKYAHIKKIRKGKRKGKRAVGINVIRRKRIS